MEEFVEKMNKTNATVVQAPPGAGKTTVLPLALLLQDPEPPWLQGRKLLLLEPRRVAAKAAARRMATSLGEKVGGRVGFRVRNESAVGPSTRIEAVTTGVLLRMLQSDPEMLEYGGVLFDEFHERNLDSDLALALCLDSAQIARRDLRVVVMSATLSGALVDRVAGLLQRCFPGQRADAIVSEGKCYPVDVVHLGSPGMRRGDLEAAACRAVLQALQHHEGDVLCFLPGAAEIYSVQRLLHGSSGLPRDLQVLPLHGNLPAEAQDAAILPSASGSRKVVLSTNLAESSLTIQGVRIVVDSGLHRQPFFDTRSGLTRLKLTQICRASAAQRAGRAGRTAPGVCLRLWSEAAHSSLTEDAAPEILNADMAPLALELAVWGSPDPAALAWLDVPDAGRVQAAVDLLVDLEALLPNRLPTPRGRLMARLGLHPRLAHMLLWARQRGDAELGVACLVAALLSDRDVLQGRGRPADLELRVEALLTGSARDLPSTAGVNRIAVREVLRRAQTLRRSISAASGAEELPPAFGAAGLSEDEEEPGAAADEGGFPAADTANAHALPPEQLLGVLLAQAYPDRIALQLQRSSQRSASFQLSGGGAARLERDDPLSSQEWLAVAELGGGGRDGRKDRIFLAAPLTKAAVQEHLSHLVQEKEKVFWADGSGAVMGRRQTCLGQLVLEEQPMELSDELALPVLREVVVNGGLGSCLSWTKEARSLQHRVELARSSGDAAQPGLPDVSEAALLDRLDDWLVPYLLGVRTRKQMAALDVRGMLRSMLSFQQQKWLDTEFPTHVQLPSGSRVPVNYASHEPQIRARLQEVFGMLDSPTVGGGRIRVAVELLSPAQRPVQLTKDLASFWTSPSGYQAVRKELKGRYPKHLWPDDPLTATATNLTKKALERKNAR